MHYLNSIIYSNFAIYIFGAIQSLQQTTFETRKFPGSLLEFQKQRAKRRTHRVVCFSYERQNKIKKCFHSPFDADDDTKCPSDILEVGGFRIVAFSSSVIENALRLISPQMGPSGHLAIYQNVYYTALAYFATCLSLLPLKSNCVTARDTFSRSIFI